MDELFGEGGCTAGYAARHEVGKEVGDFHCWASLVMRVLYLAMFGSAANLDVAAVARLTCCWRSSGLRRYCWIALAKAAGSRWGTRIPASPLSRISRGLVGHSVATIGTAQAWASMRELESPS